MAFASALALVGTALVVVGSRDGDGDPSCYTTRSTTAPAYPGRSASRVYDWVDVSAQTAPRFTPGVEVPAGLLADRYVPQGLTGWPAGDGAVANLLLISAYHDGDGDRNADGPSAVFAVVADGPRAGAGAGRMLIDTGHVGGLAVYRGWMYVGSEHEIRGWRLDTVRRALSDSSGVVQPPDYTRTSSHDVASLGAGDGRLWAARYHKTSSTPLTGYVQTSRSTGALELQPDAGGTEAPVPQKTQGVTVTAGAAIFSTSYGRRSRGNLWVVPRGRATADATPYCLRVPSMNEGVTALHGRLYLLFESGASTYDRGVLRPANPITRVHSAALTDVTSLGSGGPTD